MVKCKYILTFILIISSLFGYTQQNRYIVYFTDKDNTPYSISSPEEFLSTRSLLRRENQAILPQVRDLPVDPAYISQVQAITGEVFYPSKWLNAVLVQCSDEEIAAVESLSIVESVEFAAQGTELPEGGRVAKFKNTESVNEIVALNDFQLELHGIPALQSEGHLGEGMLVAILDGGFSGVDTIQAFRHVFEENRILLAENIVSQNSDLYTSSHGTSVFSIMAAQVPDQYTGIIPEATFMLLVTEDVRSEQRIEEYNWIVGAEKADSAGADVINTSLGYSDFDGTEMDYTYEDMDGQTTLITRGANWAAESGILVVGSAGNSGNGPWKYITAPADAFGILSVGAADIALQPASFSSFGPSSDGRVKPDVSSLGVGTLLVRSNGAVASGNGTSFAAPVIAGLVTLLWQQNPDMTAQELRSYIISLSSLSQSPGDQLGYGFPNSTNQVTSTVPNEEDILLFPNPVRRGQPLRIRMSAPVISMQVLSLEGRTQPVTFERENSDILVQTSELHGVYILLLETAERTHSLRIISK